MSYALAGLSALAFFLTLGLFVTSAFLDRTRSLLDAERTAAALARLMEEQAARALEANNLYLRHLAREAERRGWEEIATSTDFWRELEDLRQSSPVLQTIYLVDEAGVVRLESLLFPTPTLSVADLPFFKEARDNPQSPQLGELMLGPLTASYEFPVFHRILDERGNFRGMAVAAVAQSYFVDFYRSIAPGRDWTFELIGLNGAILARHPTPDGADPLALRRTVPPLAGDADETDPTTFTAVDPVDGVGRIIRIQKVADLPLFVGVGLNRDSVLAAWWERIKMQSLLVGVGLAALAGMFWFALGRARSIETQGRTLTLRVAEQTAQIRKALHDKELLLREIHHRVKNNLQIVANMIAMDPALSDREHEAARRIQAMSLAHELLYHEDCVGVIDLGELLTLLCDRIAMAFGRNARISVDCQAACVFVSAETGMPVALIANEVLTNSFKHAFPDGRQGRIEVRLTHGGGKVSLTVSDDGIGLAAPGAPARKGLGTQIIPVLAEQIGADHRFVWGNGMRFELILPATAVLPSTESLQAAQPDLRLPA